jgi:hypothetical protein
MPLPFIAREDFDSISRLLFGADKEFGRANPTYETWLRNHDSQCKKYSSGELTGGVPRTIREVRVDPVQLEKYLKREGCVPGLKALYAFVDEADG